MRLATLATAIFVLTLLQGSHVVLLLDRLCWYAEVRTPKGCRCCTCKRHLALL